MKKSDASKAQSASELISKRIAELGDWREEILDRMRKLIKQADPDVIEEWKWMGAHSPSGRVQQFWQVQSFEEDEVLPPNPCNYRDAIGDRVNGAA